MPLLTAALIAARLPTRRLPAAPPPVLPDSRLRRMMQETLAARPPGATIRVFAYGGLIWEGATLPGAVARPAWLPGRDRRFCLRDVHMRGVPEAPGLTTGLVPGAGCGGVLLDLPDPEGFWQAWRQEMRPGFYRAAWLEATDRLGRSLHAIAFLADRAHHDFADGLPEAEQAAILAEAVGPSGPGAQYLRLCADVLAAIGLPDPALGRLAGAVAHRLS